MSLEIGLFSREIAKRAATALKRVTFVPEAFVPPLTRRIKIVLVLVLVLVLEKWGWGGGVLEY
jgi:hypothetical protein